MSLAEIFDISQSLIKYWILYISAHNLWQCNFNFFYTVLCWAILQCDKTVILWNIITRTVFNLNIFSNGFFIMHVMAKLHFLFFFFIYFIFLFFLQTNTEQDNTFLISTYKHNRHIHTNGHQIQLILYSWIFRFRSDFAIQSYVKSSISDTVYWLGFKMI